MSARPEPPAQLSEGHGLRLGILCLILGLTANIGILLFAPADEGVVAVASVAALILIAVQFWREVIAPFR